MGSQIYTEKWVWLLPAHNRHATLTRVLPGQRATCPLCWHHTQTACTVLAKSFTIFHLASEFSDRTDPRREQPERRHLQITLQSAVCVLSVRVLRQGQTCVAGTGAAGDVSTAEASPHSTWARRWCSDRMTDTNQPAHRARSPRLARLRISVEPAG